MTFILRTCLLALLLTISTISFAQTINDKEGSKDSTTTKVSDKAIAQDSIKTAAKPSTQKGKKPIVNRDSINEAKAALAEARRDSARSAFAMKAARVRDSVLKAKARNAAAQDSVMKAKAAIRDSIAKANKKANAAAAKNKKAEDPKQVVKQAIATPTVVTAAKELSNGVDITTKSASFNYYVIPVGDKGVLIFNENAEKANSRGRYWTLTRYDKDFKEVYSKEIAISYTCELERYVISPTGLMHALFTQHTIAAYNSYVTSGYYEILNIDIETGKSTKTDGMLEFNLAIECFDVVGNTAFFGGKTVPPLSEERSMKTLGYVGLGIPFLFNITYIPGAPVLVCANLETGAAKFIDVKYDGSAEVSNIEADHAKGFANVTLSEYTENAESKLYVISYDQEGNERAAQVIKAKPEYLLSSGSLRNTGEEKIILGTFALDPEKELNRKKDNAKDADADGFYICKIGDVKPSFVQYFPFSRIKNFDKTTSEDEDINYGLLFHNPIIEGDQYLITAEVYTTEYADEGRFVTNEAGNLKKQAVPVFKKYTFSYAFTCGIDRTSGKMLWNTLTSMDKIHTLNMSEKASFSKAGDQYFLTFETKNAIRRKVIAASEKSEGKDIVKANNAHAGEFGQVNYRYDIQPWHNNEWLSYSHIQKKNDPLSKNPKDLKPQKAVINFSKFLVK